jgi:hypothetical protein
LGGCANEYPLAPTACDDFCRVTLRVPCDEEPEDCVRNCELVGVLPSCESAREELTACYSQAPSSAFVCVGDGFDATIRVRDSICRDERDAFLSCQEPDMSECLALCRPIQQQAVDAERVTRPLQPSSEPVSADAGSAADECLLLTQPCETLCWNLSTLSALEVEAELDAAALGSPESAIATALSACELSDQPDGDDQQQPHEGD